MGKLTGDVNFNRELARQMLADLNREEELHTSQKGASKAKAAGMPVRIKNKGSREALYLGIATDRGARHQTNIIKTAKEQIHTRVLMDRIASKTGDMKLQVPAVNLVKPQSLKDDDIKAGSQLHTESGETFSVMSCAEVRARLIQYDHDSAIQYLLTAEAPAAETLADDMLIYESAGDEAAKKLTLACLRLSSDDYQRLMGSLLKQPEKLYAFRRILASGLSHCTPTSSKDLIAMKKLYREAGESGALYLQKHMSTLPYEEALPAFNSFSGDAFLEKAASSAMMSHMALAADIQDKDAASFSEWNSQCAKLMETCQKSSDPVFAYDDVEPDEIVQSSDEMMDKLEKLLGTTDGPSFDEVAALPISVLNKLFQRICVGKPGHPMAQDIADAWENKIYEYGLNGEADPKSGLVMDCYATVPHESGDDTVETDELKREYSKLPAPSRAGNIDLNKNPDFKSIAAPAFSDIPTPALSAVKNADGEPVYPGNTVAMPYGNYLALQGPTEANVGQLWDVILHNNANVSVSLTREGEVDDPFPLEESESQFGSHTVKNIRTRTLIPGRLEVHHLLIDGKVPHVRVCMRNWTDKTGSNPAILAATAAVAKSFTDGMGTVAVNCKAGVGRTCTFIGVFEAVMAAMNNEPVQEVVDKVELMRDQRGNFGVQKPTQYQTLKVAHQYASELAKAFRPVVSVY
ncbi:hypothetical protein M3P05_02690 [Sansalvadorimonas sp. 2012CJ34-2]|uniref:Protein-tyrosine-phosphatase n=1 Tax=Parendozoicomonas callyspongiae TaxID=2942213 RepID=A0ABT0PBU9_9GAMM|nr:protein-tyrosine phosphatase family protein [Sansalvadorimonas sp. 2012CJ34-2]MCL6268857.1 hypothetical protein [Sansalvadorimonas sp. 2012CJ34-2]